MDDIQSVLGRIINAPQEVKELLRDFVEISDGCPSKYGLKERCGLTCGECWFKAVTEDD